MQTKYFRMVCCGLVICLIGLSSVYGATLVSMIGDDDGFGGTQGSNSNPGDSYSNFTSPGFAPGTYSDVNATDTATVSPFTPYTFIFNFSIDASSLSSRNSAELFIQSGSVAYVPNPGTGFAHSHVFINGTDIGEFFSSDTGPRGGAGEENVKAHTFDITSFIQAGVNNSVVVTLDGTNFASSGDLFALDFAQITVDGNDASAVPEPGTFAGLLLLTILGLFKRNRKA